MKGKRRVILLGGMVLTSLTLLTACQTSATNNNSSSANTSKVVAKATKYQVSNSDISNAKKLLINSSKWHYNAKNKVYYQVNVKYGTKTKSSYESMGIYIPAAYVKQAAEYVEGKLPICTVIGFPNGYHTTAVKVFETKNAIANGSSEIDMVINIGFLKDGRYEEVEEEIRQIHEACDGKILKVIIETCLLTEEEKIKAAGGFSSFDDAEKFISLGESRLGTSRLIKIMKNTDNGAGY